MHLFRLILAFTAVLASGPVAAQSCGDTVSGHVVLTADLHCTTGWTALYVGGPGVTIDLNGHTLSGDIALSGIALNEADGLAVRGPGTIRGFWAGINGVRSDDVAITGITFEDLDVGVANNHSDRMVVADNHFMRIRGHAVTASVLPGIAGGTVGGHRIVDNLLQDVGSGIQLCGQRSGNAWIGGNTMELVRGYGIQLEGGAGNNTVTGNRLEDVELMGIRLDGSSGNVLEGNYLDVGHAGIVLLPETASHCDRGSAGIEVRGNRISGHSIFNQAVGISMGLGTTADRLVRNNRVTDSKLYYNGVGVVFREDTFGNRIQRSAYQGTAVPVEDYGRNNRW